MLGDRGRRHTQVASQVTDRMRTPADPFEDPTAGRISKRRDRLCESHCLHKYILKYNREPTRSTPGATYVLRVRLARRVFLVGAFSRFDAFSVFGCLRGAAALAAGLDLSLLPGVTARAAFSVSDMS